MLKLTAQGLTQWERTLGGADYENASTVIQTLDGGFVVAGTSWSGISGDKSQAGQGYSDRWLIKLDAQGAKQWDLTLGGSGYEDTNTLLQNADGSYALVGSSSSGISGDKSEASRGGYDYWLTKLAAPVAPPVTISGDSVLCVGSQTQLTAQAGAAGTYEWSTGATTASIVVRQGGTYTVRATYPSGVSVTAAYRVVARPRSPGFTLGADTTLCPGQLLVLRPIGTQEPGLTYRWSDGSVGRTLAVRQSGEYRLTITGCNSQTATRQVAFETCPVVIPNIITPNGDLLNERFSIRGLSAGAWVLVIYNRWGRQVYTTENYQHDWGAEAAAGLYYYHLQQPGTPYSYKGWVEVRR